MLNSAATGEVDTHQQKQGQSAREEPVAVLTAARVDNLQREDPIMEWTDRSRLSIRPKVEGCVNDFPSRFAYRVGFNL